jgi:Tfp pilus assembly protein PilN
MKAVNLLPSDRRGQRRTSPLAPIVAQPLLVLAVVVAIAVLGGVGMMLRSASSTVSARQSTLRDLETQIARLPKPKPQTGATTQAARLSAVTSVASQRTHWDGFLSAVALVMPEDVWLLNLSAAGQSATTPATPPSSGSSSTPPPAPAAPAPTGFVLTGYTYSQPSVARLMRRLELVPWLQGVSLSTSSKTTLANHVIYQFTVGASVVSFPEVKS